MTNLDPTQLTGHVQVPNPLIDLTDEEHAALFAEDPPWLEALTTSSTQGKYRLACMMLERWLRKRADPEGYAREQAAIRAERGEYSEQKSRPGQSAPPGAASAPAVLVPEIVESEQEEEPKSRRPRGRKKVPVPTDVARCSFFYPMRHNGLGKRTYVENVLVAFGRWGQVYLSGPQMSTQDEDVLLALIAVMLERPEYVRTNVLTDCEGLVIMATEEQSGEMSLNLQATYLYSGPLLPIARKLGYQRPNKKDYARIFRSIELLAGCVAKEFEVADGKLGFRRVKLTHLLEKAVWNVDEQRLEVCLTPLLFRAMISARGVKVSLIDLKQRFALSGEISKALHRFMSSHSGELKCHFSKVAEAINMDTTQPTFKQRQLLKTAVIELVQQGFLTKSSGFVDTDTIHLIKAGARKSVAP